MLYYFNLTFLKNKGAFCSLYPNLTYLVFESSPKAARILTMDRVDTNDLALMTNISSFEKVSMGKRFGVKENISIFLLNMFLCTEA